ncbi:SPOR domain-containing protein [Fretibacter rubidus]|uniref:SPOR domain-containing protein n=1 Tax=Fretibacter rubidus TaxID=570162 RepID=UPI00352A8815
MTTSQNDNSGYDSPPSGGGPNGYDGDEPLVPFDVRDHTGRRSIYVLTAFIVGLLLLALLVFFIYQPGTRDRDSAPIVAADDVPFKVTPENPGGAQTPDQDKAVYDVMAGNDVNETVTPAPASERPVEMPKTANIEVAAPKPVTEAPKVTTPAPIATRPAPQASTRPAPAPVATGGSDYVVQIASLRNRADAVDLWNTVSGKFSNVLPSGLYSDIKQVDLGDKGIYYRLRVAGMADQAAAKRLCDQFKARGQACIVARK